MGGSCGEYTSADVDVREAQLGFTMTEMAMGAIDAMAQSIGQGASRRAAFFTTVARSTLETTLQRADQDPLRVPFDLVIAVLGEASGLLTPVRMRSASVLGSDASPHDGKPATASARITKTARRRLRRIMVPSLWCRLSINGQSISDRWRQTGDSLRPMEILRALPAFARTGRTQTAPCRRSQQRSASGM